MRHRTGKELIGMPQFLGARIGVVEVAPDDDLRTVLIAILAEDRLKRTHIVLELPQINIALRRPEDDDPFIHKEQPGSALLMENKTSIQPLQVESVQKDAEQNLPTTLKKLDQSLRSRGKPIMSWPDQAEAFVNVARGIQKVVDGLIGNNVPG